MVVWIQSSSEDKVILLIYVFIKLTFEILKYLLNIFCVVTWPSCNKPSSCAFHELKFLNLAYNERLICFKVLQHSVVHLTCSERLYYMWLYVTFSVYLHLNFFTLFCLGFDIYCCNPCRICWVVLGSWTYKTSRRPCSPNWTVQFCEYSLPHCKWDSRHSYVGDVESKGKAWSQTQLPTYSLLFIACVVKRPRFSVFRPKISNYSNISLLIGPTPEKASSNSLPALLCSKRHEFTCIAVAFQALPPF